MTKRLSVVQVLPIYLMDLLEEYCRTHKVSRSSALRLLTFRAINNKMKPISGSKHTSFQYHLQQSDANAIDLECQRYGITRQEFIRQALEHSLIKKL